MTYLEILKAARKLIASKDYNPSNASGQRYICKAIDRVVTDQDCQTYFYGGKLKIWIDEMLGNSISLYVWLKHNVDIDVTFEQTDAHRVAWLDKLIREWK